MANHGGYEGFFFCLGVLYRIEYRVDSVLRQSTEQIERCITLDRISHGGLVSSRICKRTQCGTEHIASLRLTSSIWLSKVQWQQRRI